MKKMPEPNDSSWRDELADLLPLGLYAQKLKFVYVISSKVRTETWPREYGSREEVTRTWREYKYYDFQDRKIFCFHNGLMCENNRFVPVKEPEIVSWAMHALHSLAKRRKDAFLEIKPFLDEF